MVYESCIVAMPWGIKHIICSMLYYFAPAG